MRLRYVCLALCGTLCLGLGCGSTQSSDEPTTAKEKQKRDEAAKGDADGGKPKWGGWRYTGARDDCFFVVGRKCFKTEAEACSTGAKCKGATKCVTTGGGPATVSCAAK